MKYVIARSYIIGDDDEPDVVLDILSVDAGPLIFHHRLDAEDFLDAADDVDVEMAVIEAPEGIKGVEVV